MKLRRSKTVFITGAAGLLGRHLQRSPAARSFELVAPGSGVLDIRHRERVLDMITEWKPQAVIHLAYRKDDRRTIVNGSQYVAEAAAGCGARLVHLSTDVVFAGRQAPYREADEPFPITEYGRMKADAELAVSAACPGAAIVRTSLLYGTDIESAPQRDVQRALRGGERHGVLHRRIPLPRARQRRRRRPSRRLLRCQRSAARSTSPGPEALSRAEFAAAIARWLGLNPARLRTTSLAASGLDRPGRLVLDCSHAATLGLTCRPVAEALAPN